jgi:hypothetical protein
MSLNLNCCPNLKLGSLCSSKPRTESPPPEPSQITPVVDYSDPHRLGEPIVLVDNDPVFFETLIPNHREYLYLKILNTYCILCAVGGLLVDLKMKRDDLIDVNLRSLKKNQDLFGDFIYSLVSKTFENKTSYQFCFRLGRNQRILCCSIYLCPIPGHISSVDCVIRPIIKGFKHSLIDKYILSLNSEERDNSSRSTYI